MPEQEEAAVQFVKKNSKTLKELVLPAVLPDKKVSATKLYTLLHGKGIRKWRARKHPPLNAEIAETRRQALFEFFVRQVKSIFQL